VGPMVCWILAALANRRCTERITLLMLSSRPVIAVNGRLRVALATFLALVALSAALGASPPQANASFTVAACSGSAIQGEGSSFQKVAQQQFWIPTVFYSSFGCGSGAATSSPVTYNGDGSGCGIASMGGGGSTGKCSDFQSEAVSGGYRDPNTRFGGSDAPMTPAQEAAANAAGGPNPGVLHTLPVANGDEAVVVHFPEGCELENPAQGGGNGNTSTGAPNDPAGKATGDTAANHDLRVHIPASMMERIWEGTPTTWGEVVSNHITGTPTSPLEAEELVTECKNVPVRRIVRFDGSGTTYNFKAYLSLLPGVTPSGVWTTSPVVGDNHTWPLTTSATGVPPAVPKIENAGEKEFVNVCNKKVSINGICTGFENGNGAMSNAVAATDGSIGYPDLATARQKGFDIVPTTSGTPDHTYWVPLQTINPSTGNTVGANYVEPTASPLSHINGGGSPDGSNCTNADYRGLPTTPASDPTLGDWSNAIATGSEDSVTYPACALTYLFAFDDDAPVYGNTMPEQLKARTVKDYLTTIESSAGQFGLASADYGTLPGSVITIAQNGVAAIGWDKTAGAGTGGGGGTVTPPPTTTTTTTTNTTAITAAVPINAFSIAAAKIKNKSIVLSLVLPGAGRVQVKATGGGVSVANLTATVSGGQGTVTLPISSAAQKKITRAKSKKLAVTVSVTFTPNGGTAATQAKKLTITQAAIASKVKKKTKKKAKKNH
jgi:hypothetical protein